MLQHIKWKRQYKLFLHIWGTFVLLFLHASEEPISRKEKAKDMLGCSYFEFSCVVDPLESGGFGCESGCHISRKKHVY